MSGFTVRLFAKAFLGILLAIGWVSPGKCYAEDSVLLKSGTLLSGEIVYEDDDLVIIKTAEGREKVRRDKIQMMQKGGVKSSSPASAAQNDDGPAGDFGKCMSRVKAAAEASDWAEANKWYDRCVKLQATLPVYRQLARLYFETAEGIYSRNKPEFESSRTAWNEAKEAAMVEKKTLAGKYRELDVKNPNYAAATRRMKELKAKLDIAGQFYSKAGEAFGSILRLSPNQQDFEAAACQTLCLIVKDEIQTQARARQLLFSFLTSYKPSNATEEALYRRCKEIQDKFHE